MKRTGQERTMETKLIHKLAYLFRSSGLPHEDLFQEACVAYLSAEPKWKQKQGMKSTFLWTVMYNHLCDYVVQEKQQAPMESVGDLESIFENPLKAALWREALQGMSSDTRELCVMILQDPAAFITGSQKKSVSRVMSQCLSLGWKLTRVKVCFREVRTVLACLAAV